MLEDTSSLDGAQIKGNGTQKCNDLEMQTTWESDS